MKNLSFIIILLSSTVSIASLRSHFPSSVDGLDIPNSHIIIPADDRVAPAIRGMAPLSWDDVDQLQELGIESVLVFKKETRAELTGPKGEFNKLKKRNIRYKHIPFPWKDLNFKKACHQMISAIDFIRRESAQGRPVFFHCTVGEDRTGALSGLYRVLFDGWSKEKAFKEEMCERGFADGNPKKPYFVSNKIRESLTPFFFRMIEVFKNKELDHSLCSKVTPPSNKRKKKGFPTCSSLKKD